VSAAADSSPKNVLAVGLALGLVSATLTALPAAIRVSAAGASLPASWLLLSGATALILGPFVASLRWLRMTTPRLGEVRVSFFALLVALAPLVLFGLMLKEGTHHRPLGGATFAVVAAVVIALSIACLRRLLIWFHAEEPAVRFLGRGLFALSVGVGASLAVLLVLRLGLTPSPLQAGALDGLRALGLGAIAAYVPLPPALSRGVTRFGLPIWAGVVMVAAGLCQKSALAQAADREAPVLLAPVGWCSTGLGGS
jgi:hypothetical protein